MKHLLIIIVELTGRGSQSCNVTVDNIGVSL